MSFQLYVSNDLHPLCQRLQQQFDAARRSVFQPHYVITQTEGMCNWIKVQVATKASNGIAANIRLLKPTDFIHTVYQMLGGTFNRTLDADSLCWLLFRILGEQSFVQRFPAIAAYYPVGLPDSDTKRLALARQLADLMDQYQIYRPDYITEWNGATDLVLSEHDWQQYVWLRARQLAGTQLADKTEQAAWIISQMNNTDAVEQLVSRMPEVHLFGLSIIAPYHLRIMEALGRHIDFHFYLLNPAPQEFWYDSLSEKQIAWLAGKGVVQRNALTPGNAMLTSWGKVLKDTFGLLFENDELLNNLTEVGVAEPDTDTLLHTLQQDVFYNRNNEERAPIAESCLADGTVHINSCFTIAREVECLYNYLVHLSDKKGVRFAPRDVVVMVSDIDAYAPYIKAVFEHAPHPIPYNIADEGFGGSDNIVNALRSLLELSDDDCSAEKVLQLLDAASIRKRFGLSQTALLRSVVEKANIRFGCTGSKDDDTVYVSWQYGLQRIMLGICLGDEAEYGSGDDSLFPLNAVEGAEAQELVRFCHFVQVLMAALEQRKDARTVVQWVKYVEWVLENLVQTPDADAEEDLVVLQQQLRNYNELQELVHENISWEVFSQHFLQQLSAASRSAAFAKGGITFCSLIPMRSIPFKVVAMLGMSFDKFPRKDQPASFNLLQQGERRRGDRSVKDNDKHLFLETLLSAKEYLYISYLGQSVKDNSVLPPSALVDELLDYIDAQCPEDGMARKQLVCCQPLHGFSTQYRRKDSGLYSYLQSHQRSVDGLVLPAKERTAFNPDTLELDELVRFFKHPIKAFYQEVLGVKYEEVTALLPETELFALDKLNTWQLKQELWQLEDTELSVVRNRYIKTGKLPLKNMADVALQQVCNDLEQVRMQLQAFDCDGCFEPVTVTLQLRQLQLGGVLEKVHKGRLVAICFSRNTLKYQLEAYIRYLAGAACGLLDGVYFVTGETFHKGTVISRTEAKEKLEQLVDLYLQGHQQVLPFLPDLDVKLKDLEQPNAGLLKKKVKDKIGNSQFADPYLQQEVRSGSLYKQDAGERFFSLCKILIEPLATLFPSAHKK